MSENKTKFSSEMKSDKVTISISINIRNVPDKIKDWDLLQNLVHA